MRTTTKTNTTTTPGAMLLSARAVAAMCGVSVSTVRRWKARGLPYVRLGGTVRFERQVVEQLVAAGRCTEAA